ncbi:IclR family transcriptional regulator [Jiangella mangrovi]|uniref:DNA-binding IclR family transcriptional regulator n=1 Tax=Jiangella mangrovi TaxID=1524084 RepID=A0A7W9GU27_9ACTN|nr:IclR family transcriptional regulator [Jiangella mangrovi]MBB5790083.1 DNA-binding IclR family transcriptional regulator [Jiangella mangrovi]
MEHSVAYPIESVGNALRLIHLLQDSDELRVTDAARTLGVAPSTAHRLMTMLVHHGFAEQNARRTYQRGWALRGDRHRAATEDIIDAARLPLVELGRRIGETVHLARLEGTAVVFVDGVESPRRHQVHVASRAGLSMLAHCTAAGKAILAGLQPAELAALYPRGLPHTYGPGPCDLGALQRQLAAIRRLGYSVNDEESERGLIGVGVALRDHAGRPVAAVATGIPILRCPDALIPGIADELTRTARAVEASLAGGASAGVAAGAAGGVAAGPRRLSVL